MKVETMIQLLVDYRVHKKGHIGKIIENFEKDTAKVDLNYYDFFKAPHHIFINKADENIFWKFFKKNNSI